MDRFAWCRTDEDDAKLIVVVSWKPRSGEAFAVVVEARSISAAVCRDCFGDLISADRSTARSDAGTRAMPGIGSTSSRVVASVGDPSGAFSSSVATNGRYFQTCATGAFRDRFLGKNGVFLKRAKPTGLDGGLRNASWALKGCSRRAVGGRSMNAARRGVPSPNRERERAEDRAPHPPPLGEDCPDALVSPRRGLPGEPLIARPCALGAA
jgi:hypothetical protein